LISSVKYLQKRKGDILIHENEKVDLVIMDKYRNIKPWVWPALLILLSLALYSRGVFNEDTFYPDADRIAMDGIYFHDLIKDMPFADIYNYTIRYFAQYPALSIGYRMPFFQVIEGIFYLILGISMSTAKISVLFFAAFFSTYL